MTLRLEPRRPNSTAHTSKTLDAMTVARLALLLLVIVGNSALGQKQSFVGWLIYPSQKHSPAIDLPTEQGPWRLLRHDRSVITEMPQPPLKKGYTFNFGECRVNSTIRHDLIAMVRHSKSREWSKDVAAVWVADPEVGQFVQREGSGVECRNEGYGV
jgi:hypothetical protein